MRATCAACTSATNIDSSSQSSAKRQSERSVHAPELGFAAMTSMDPVGLGSLRALPVARSITPSRGNFSPRRSVSPLALRTSASNLSLALGHQRKPPLLTSRRPVSPPTKPFASSPSRQAVYCSVGNLTGSTGSVTSCQSSQSHGPLLASASSLSSEGTGAATWAWHRAAAPTTHSASDIDTPSTRRHSFGSGAALELGTLKDRSAFGCGPPRLPSTPSTNVDSVFAESTCSHSPDAGEGSTLGIPFAGASYGWSQAEIDSALDEVTASASALATSSTARTQGDRRLSIETTDADTSSARAVDDTEAGWWPSPRLTMDPKVGVSIAQAETWRDEYRQLRCLRNCMDMRISHEDEALEKLSNEWNSCYLRLSAQRLLEAALSAARSGSHRSFVEMQLRGALREARSAGLGASDELVQRAEGILEEQEALDEQEASERENREAASDHLSQVVFKAYDTLGGARTDLEVLKEARLQLITAHRSAQEAGLPAAELREAEACRRKVHHAIQDFRGQVRVLCHLRPLNSRELRCAEPGEAVRLLDCNTVEVPEVGAFSFDGIYAEGSTQEEIFEDCRDLVQSAVDGYNVTIFSYGQSGAGKTYTMTGTPEAEGLSFRVIDELFAVLDGLHSQCSIEVSASMCELYNGQPVDLLRPVNRGRTGGAASGASPGVGGGGAMSSKAFTDLSGVRSEIVRDHTELRALLNRGLQRRRVSPHATNDRSSRSHLIFTIQASTIDLDTRQATTGKIVLCDLAGSERLKKTESQGAQKREAIEINKSLAALGKVIEAAAGKRKQVPYREHKLTQILQDSIGGTAKTIMIVNCSPAASSVGETLTSLRYGQRARRIVNSPMRIPSKQSVASTEASPSTIGDFERSSEVSHCADTP